MANTTTITIVHCDEEDAIDSINAKCKTDFKNCYDGTKCGGKREDHSILVHTCCYNDREINEEFLESVINCFMQQEFDEPEKTVLVITSASFDNRFGYAHIRNEGK